MSRLRADSRANCCSAFAAAIALFLLSRLSWEVGLSLCTLFLSSFHLGVSKSHLQIWNVNQEPGEVYVGLSQKATRIRRASVPGMLSERNLCGHGRLLGRQDLRCFITSECTVPILEMICASLIVGAIATPHVFCCLC